MKHSYIDKYSNLDSCIHKRDPRIKIFTFFTCILFVIFTRPTSFVSFGLYGSIIFSMILLSRIPIGFILKRSLVVIPFVLMIAIFIPFFKKGEITGGYSFGTLSLTVSYDGLIIFWNILVKAYLCILSMVLLITSSRFSDLLKAMEKLKCPSLFVMILSFMYRYIFLIADELMKMKQAKEARSTGRLRFYNTKVLANMIGVLFIRSYERAESVYLAMCSRGFYGKIRTMNNFRLKSGDFYFLAAVLCSLIGIRILAG